MKHRVRFKGALRLVNSEDAHLAPSIALRLLQGVSRVCFLLFCLWLALLPSHVHSSVPLTSSLAPSNTATGANPPNSAAPLAGSLQLASSKPLPPESELPRYLVSEKLDGVRARWTGQTLVTRSGNLIAPPAWFIAALPADVLLDGELWAGRGRFEWLSGLVRSRGRDDDWYQVQLMVFDTPQSGLGFAERHKWLQARLSDKTEPLKLVEQRRFQHLSELNDYYQAVIRGGGEGLMLHREDALYIDGRNPLLIKLKPLNDTEGQVIGYRAGKGQFEGMMGALHLRLLDGREFFLGSGFSFDERRHPPAIGAWVTFQYHGLTDKGLPKGARFLRVRPME
ncbi:DNA ligase [Shewanella amazonensis]|uniref:DNA ligase n=1 Tax=Shewanella amazonensis TaxID=60478 RepID=UPI0000551A30|nr:DNA ligase [Shewanella amazonensis]